MSRCARRLSLVLSVLLPVALGAPLSAHNLSPRAGVSQHVGKVVVAIDYSRPGVRGREIWGELVPWDQIWKTGADRMTNISFSAPVLFGGQRVEPGTYGILTIPGQERWTFVLTRSADIHMPSTYSPETDLLRLELEPEEGPFRERLLFLFEELTMDGAELVLEWEKLRLRIPIQEVAE